jgi:predicted deacylase
VRRVLAALGMVEPVEGDAPTPSLVSRSSGWVRARRTGILQLDAVLGQRVEVGDRLGSLSDSFGKTLRLVHADRSGIVIGRTTTPLVNRGDALTHIAGVEPNGTGGTRGAEEHVEQAEALSHAEFEPDLS